MTMDHNGFSPTQRRMLEVLSDGQPHAKSELHKACGPCSEKTVVVHIFNLRKKLQRHGHDVACRRVRSRWCYQHVRLLAPSDE